MTAIVFAGLKPVVTKVLTYYPSVTRLIISQAKVRKKKPHNYWGLCMLLLQKIMIAAYI
jgi:hypothetical protein